jgi:tRNA U34 2-thiouridine synthase MnmA/TrmU
MTRGIGLVSGGLDSSLAVKLIMEQGIEVLGVTFTTAFFGPDCAVAAASELQIPLRIVDITQPHFEIVVHPPHGYGKHMNPCIDCHILMVREGGRMMEEIGADFVFTGEVLGQRPMSQNKASLRRVVESAGYPGKVLRPLSAKLLPMTIPERQGVVDREQLLDIRGRARRRQMELASRYAIMSYASPAGGCLLTDVGFSRRLQELLDHQETLDVRDVELLKVGRHLRLPSDVKLLVGRNAGENQRLLELAVDGDELLQVDNYPGPVVLILGECSTSDVITAASITARYSDAPDDEAITVKWKRHDREQSLLTRSCPRSLPKRLMI